MGEFNINLSHTRNAAENLTNMATLFGHYKESLNHCASEISLIMRYPGINAALRSASGNIVLQQSQLKELSESLKKIAQLYEKSENKILGQGKDAETPEGKKTSEAEKKGAIENALEKLEEIIGHDAVSFITALVEAFAKIEGLGTGVDITAGVLTMLNYLLDDLQDGATINSLYANVIVSLTATVVAMGAGEIADKAITGIITSACAAATGGIGAAIAPFAKIIGKVIGTGISVVTGHLVDDFNEADWDHDGESNRDEIKNAVETVLNWKYPHGDDHTFYLPEGI